MESKFLETYLAIVAAGSIAEAARQLDLPSTTVAQQIKALEKEIGCRLLARAGQTVKPTEAGYRILQGARAVVRETRDMRSQALGDELPAGPLRLGAVHSALMGLLPPALREWNRRYAGIKIFIEPGNSMPLIDKVADGELDAALIVHPLFALPKSCDWVPLRKESLVLLTPATMVVKDPLETIAREPFIRFDRTVVAGKLADDFLVHHSIRPNEQFELDGIEEISKFVSEGLGVSIVPNCPPIGFHDTSVRRWALPFPAPARSVGMLKLRSSVRLPLVKALTRLLLEHVTPVSSEVR
ncbi:LysR family transcriptional regulator [Pandoraea anhela]|uniref:LysR family transcriptional regulator n=1 Tax=Pandoraea anhela TaxID=2508295 RepID=A0A5E4R8V3_9BURK|nr:LysR family transcriptional regulator [Pandoraea anhela]VVD59044.1 LysR family transcriptional regulator [Pandoraea anhela]